MLNLNKVKTYSLKKRYSKVRAGDSARPPAKRRSFRSFFKGLPDVLKARELREVVKAVITAHRKRRPVILMCGAHVIKCGLNPVVIHLLKKGVINCLCLNGAGIIHDYELALQGETSEDVAHSLHDGSFGMARETADFINSAGRDGVREGLGLGYAVAGRIASSRLKHKNESLLYNAYTRGVPVCVFVAVGTDIIHQHPSFDAALTAQGSLRDFHTLTGMVGRLDKGGVVLNFGSAVILPEVFLKALNL
ncbi:MAG: deoxyhypusine synthase family protein, partial [Candidatus Omnitrophica bacterium]|nr:deoxyhypusine synthase family protein [Candidatus Omnitrophota bacterium]